MWIGIPVVVLALLPVIHYSITDMYMDAGKELPILTKLVIAGYLPYVLACIATLI
jgi:hypothetical protein